MGDKIQWQRGKFLKFFAQMKIRLGGKDAMDIQKDDEFEYDGVMVRYAGAEFASPMRGAIDQGWAVLDPANATAIAPFTAPRDIAKSQSKNSDLSRVQRTKAATLETNSLDEETVLEVGDRRPGGRTNVRAEPVKMTAANNRRSTAGQRVMDIRPSDMDGQEGVTVGKVVTAAKLKVEDITKETNLADRLENRHRQKPELYTSKTTVREGVTIKTNIGDMDRSIHVAQEDDGQVVAQVRHTKTSRSEGIEVKDTSGSQGQKSEVRPKPVKKIDKSKLSDKHKTALLFDPNFPIDWNFMAPMKARVEKAKQSDDPVFIKALYAAENEAVKKELVKIFPKVFA